MNDQSALTNETRIAEAINEALEQDKATAPFNIDVAVVGSTASLTGEVDSDETKKRAEQIARSVGGVVDVTNELMVRSHAGTGLGLFGDANARDDAGMPAPLGGIALAGAAGASSGAAQGAGGVGYGPGGIAALGAIGAANADDTDDTDNADRNR